MTGVLLGLAIHANTLTIENPGIRLELFLKEMEHQTGETYRCPVVLKNEVLAASFENQPLETVKTQLAKVLNAGWEKKSDGWWLDQSSEQKREEKRWNSEQRLALYKWQIDALKQDVPKSEWTVAEFQKYWNAAQNPESKGATSIKAGRFKAMMNTPEGRFEARIAAQLRPEYFYTEGLYRDLLHYSPRGLAQHLPLAIDIDEPLRLFQNEMQIYSTVTGQRGGSVAAPAHVEVRNSDRGIPELSMVIYDQQWNYVSSCWLSIDLDTSPVEAEGESFPLSNATKKRLDYYDLLEENRYDRKEDGRMRADPEFAACRDGMLNATKADPLGLRQGLCWIDFAKSKHQPLLVSLEEDAYQFRPHYLVPKPGQSGLKIGMERIDDGGWTLGRPRNPLLNRTWRTDRSLVERFSKLVYSPEFLSLNSQIQIDDIIRYSYSTSSGIPNEAFLIGYDYRGNGPFCLLGCMSSDQLDAAIRGDRFTPSQLAPRAATYLTELWANGNLNALSPRSRGDFACAAYCLPNRYQGMTIGANETQVPVFTTSTESTATGVPLGRFAGFIYQGLQNKEPANLDKPFQTWQERAITAEVHLGDKVVTQTVSEPGPGERHTFTWKTAPDSVKKPILDTIKLWFRD